MGAMGARFKDQGVHSKAIQDEIGRKTERACSMVMMRVAAGTVELSTIQTLCILSMLEFTGMPTPSSVIMCPLTFDPSTQRVTSSALGPTLDLLLISSDI